jgi:hypothetical protein
MSIPSHSCVCLQIMCEMYTATHYCNFSYSFSLRHLIHKQLQTAWDKGAEKMAPGSLSCLPLPLDRRLHRPPAEHRVYLRLTVREIDIPQSLMSSLRELSILLTKSQGSKDLECTTTNPKTITTCTTTACLSSKLSRAGLKIRHGFVGTLFQPAGSIG